MTMSATSPVSRRGPSSSMASLFGEDDAAALWFDKEAFTASDFNSEAYIADLRKFVALEIIRAELRRHLGALKTELVELINRDYTDFVNLTTKLVDVDAAVLRMRTPLNELRRKLSAARHGLHSSLSTLQDGLRRRAEASESREILELLLDTSHVVSKVEKLLLELQNVSEDGAITSLTEPIGLQPSSNGALDSSENNTSLEESRSRLLERIASEMNRLKFYVARAEDLPFIQNMEKRIHTVGTMLDASLSRCFEIGLEHRDETVLYRCLRAYAAIDNLSGAQEVFRTFVVAPILQHIFPLKESLGRDGDLLEEDFKELEQLIEKNCKFLLDLAASDSGMNAFDFLGNSVLKELNSAIQRRKPGAFSPGKPAEFLANYKASLKFLNFLEGFCTSQQAISAFRSQPAYLDFMKQWNLGIYFTLRFQEIAAALDSVLATPTLSLVQDIQLPQKERCSILVLQSSTTLYDCLERCWHSDVYIPSLSDKFLSLTLQLLSRYSTWLRTGLTARKAGNTGNGVEWALTASPENFLLVRHDVELLATKIKASYIDSILSHFHLGSADIAVLVKQSILQGAESLLEAMPIITDIMVETLTKKSVEVLMQLKGITATYRMTNKPLPIRHSPYVSGVLQPLKVFLEGDHASFLSNSLRTELTTAIIERITARFDKLASELVTTAKKTESSLQRLRQGRTGAAGTDPSDKNISDTDKICMQLYLDVMEYGRRLQGFGISATDLPTYTSLVQCVAPPDKQAESEF